MLRISNVRKSYEVGGVKMDALDGVSVSFRKNEFVSVLGPSGSGKTTLLNIIGGLDKYTDGDLIIAGTSTKVYKDRDWDHYRNQRIGFIFQAYNLIPHQTILGNVELALTISGVSKKERRERAIKALEEVGLKGQERKRPNQLSGGQCQRVAIARALVNNPEILLADEPTGALDTKTSEQIMKLIKKIANERLVIMVTHNPDIAERYSSRIINLLDGKIVSDTKPFSEEDEIKEVANFSEDILNKSSKAKMNWPTAIALSGRNLISKLKRSLLVAIAGSIGIIGVSSVLAVSNGITTYVTNMQDDMLSSYPITITETSVDYTSLMAGLSDSDKAESIQIEDGKIKVDSMIQYLMEKYKDVTAVKTNDINHDLVNYISNMPKDSYSSLSYSYGIDVTNNIFTTCDVLEPLEKKEISLNSLTQMYISELKTVQGFDEYSQFVSLFTNFMKVLPGGHDYIVGKNEKNGQYDLLAGSFATEENEIMIVVDKKQTLTDLLFAQLGFFNQDQFINLAKRAIEEAKETPDEALIEEYTSKTKDSFSYDELVGKEFTYFPHDTIYSWMDNPLMKGYIYSGIRDSAWGEGYKLKISGVLIPNENTNFGCLSRGVYYTPKFAEKYMRDTKTAKILTATPESTGTTETGLYAYLKSSAEANLPFIACVTYPYTSFVDPDNPVTATGVASALNVGQNESFSSLFSMSSGKVDYFDVDKMYLRSLSGQCVKESTAADSQALFSKEITELGTSTYYNIDLLPEKISIYPKNFDAKDSVTGYLDQWNKEISIDVNGKTLAFEDRVELTYSDTIEMIINVINTLIDIVTTALIAFTSLSLVVSCFMIAVITYISVVERVKEIGVIRSLGGRKRDVRNLFVAETFIIGLSSGTIGVGVTYLLCAILNAILVTKGIPAIGLFNPVHALIMIAVSFALTVLSGLIPSGNASKQNPVDALRSE